MSGDGGSKDFWDKLSALSGMVAAILVPLVLGLVGTQYSQAIKVRETSLKEQEFARQWVQISLDILRDEGTTENVALRDWAIRVINHYTDPAIHLDEPAKQELRSGAAILPQASVPTAAGGQGGGSRVETVEALESLALNALLERDIDTAIAQMKAAYDLWPVFRTVEETLALLRSRREALLDRADEAAWTALYRDLLATMDTRGVPAATVAEMRRLAGG